jgi:hypothetical protein
MAILDRERLTVYPRIFVVLYVVIGGWWILSGPGLLDRNGKPVGGDFVTFYGASALLQEGAPEALFDIERIHEAERAGIGEEVERFAWHYPPPAMLLVYPLAWAPYGVALALWLAGSLVAYGAAVRALDRDAITLGLALAFPGLFQNVIHGQNGCFSMALLGGGLAALPARPLLGGALLGLLVYKPHLVPMAGLALLAGRQWRALAGLAISSVAVCGLSLAAFGAGAWQAFLENLPFAQAVLYEGGVNWAKMPTVSAAVLLLGGGAGVARALQGVASVAAAGAVGWAWLRGHPLKEAVLALGVLLATPFAFEYDLTVLALPLIWIGIAGRDRGWQPGDKALLILGWTLPFLATALAGPTHLQVGPLVIAALLVAALRRS